MSPKAIERDSFGADSDGNVHKLNTEYTVDAGRSSAKISQFIKWSVTSCIEYKIETGGYILACDSVFIDSGAVSNYTLTLRTTWSEEHSFSFEKSEGRETSNRLSASFGVKGYGTVEGSFSSTQSSSTTIGYSYSFGEQKTVERTYTFDFSKVPSGYVVSPCVISNALIISYNYTYYDHWWWGDYPVRTKELTDVSNTILIFDPETTHLTYCIKKPNQPMSSALYLRCE